ncbi:SDR family oxidoreductase [Pararhizobium sp.]|uniref:SDR family oxidoreductase n=1 Tax=Pararhizobium sp. TaxID=1977563 RepID=UPI0039C9890C
MSPRWAAGLSTCRAKAALEGALRYLAAELGPRYIRAQVISPWALVTRAHDRRTGSLRGLRL